MYLKIGFLCERYRLLLTIRFIIDTKPDAFGFKKLIIIHNKYPNDEKIFLA